MFSAILWKSIFPDSPFAVALGSFLLGRSLRLFCLMSERVGWGRGQNHSSTTNPSSFKKKERMMRRWSISIKSLLSTLCNYLEAYPWAKISNAQYQTTPHVFCLRSQKQVFGTDCLPSKAFCCKKIWGH